MVLNLLIGISAVPTTGSWPLIGPMLSLDSAAAQVWASLGRFSLPLVLMLSRTYTG